MRRIVSSLCLSFTMLLAAVPAARPYTYQHTPGVSQVRWPGNTITIQISSSFNSPANVKAGNDAQAAVRRALRRWSDAANINFNIVNAAGEPSVITNDGVNLITISPATGSFVAAVNPGRARVSFDPATGNIVEADLAINPNIQFSTDGTPNTYDLESTLVHELGHFIGLDHSGLVGATMQPRQSPNFTNGVFTLTQTTLRTLSDDDLAGIRSLYGQRTPQAVGSIAGTLNYPAGAHVWAQNSASGRIVGSAITKNDGSYRIDQVPPGDYRVIAEYLDGPVLVNEITAPRGPYSTISSGAPFRAVETTANIAAGATVNVSLAVGAAAPSLNLRLQGLNGILHGGPMPVAPGGSYRYYLGGDGVEAVTAADISFDTPFIVIDRASFTREDNNAYGIPYALVSFNIRLIDTAKWGDYTVRVRRADTGEVEFMAGGLTVDPYTDFGELNPIDNTSFFVRQQYRDFLFREPEEPGFSGWVNTLNNCPNQFNVDPNNSSANCDRILVSRAFFSSEEFRLKGFFVYRFYRVAFNRQPLYSEIIPDMISVTGTTQAEVFQRRDAFTTAFAQRAEFAPLAAAANDAYVNTLMGRYNLSAITTPDPANPNGTTKVTLTRADLINRLNAGTLSKAQVLRAVAESDGVFNAEFNRGFVSMQYFGYLKRDAEEPGFTSWLNTLNANPADFRTMVNGFVNSREYRSRFGPS